MVRIRDIKDDTYYFDEENYCLTGRRNKHSLRLGDPLRIEIKGANLVKKQLDFAIVEQLEKKKPTEQKQEQRSKQKEKPSAQNKRENKKGDSFKDEWGFEV